MKFFNLHTHHFTGNSDIFELVNQYPLEFDAAVPNYSIGLHPWKINLKTLEDELSIIERKLNEPNCLALGECGLDKRIEIPLDIQISVFEKQLTLAQQYQKPVVIHCVAAFGEVIACRKRLKVSVPMIIHGFSKNTQTAKQLLDHGFYLSFGKYLLQNPELEEVFKSVPNDRFFLETDTIEEDISAVYALAANYKKLNDEQLHDVIGENFNAVFSNNLTIE